jgi:excisionase family DNA binding protein
MNSKDQICEGLFNRSQMARYLGISERKLSTMVSLRQIPVIKIGRCVRFDHIDVRKALNKLTIESI